jgi:hypothetical protein
MASKLERVKLLLEAEKSPRLQRALIEKCRTDMWFWFDWFSQTFDPRTKTTIDKLTGEEKRVPIGVIPFNLYPFQRDFITALETNAKAEQDTAIEKCRDMGASWGVIAWMYWNWLFTPSAQFLIGSLTAQDVDSGELESAIFGKLRILLNYTPLWMLPQGFNDRDHNTSMKLINPTNGAKIKGRAPVPNFGRSGRYMAIVFDEGAFWPDFAASWASCGAVTSSSRVAVSTPNGREFFYKLINGQAQPDIRRITMPWHLNPRHDQAWYDDCKRRYTPSKFAREIEISYSDSLEGRVFNFNPAIHGVSGKYELNNSYKTIAVFDFGNASAATLHQLTPQGHLRTFKEFVFMENGETENLAAVVTHYLSELGLTPQDVLCAADPAGATKNNQTGFSEMDILQRYGFYPQYDKISAIRSRVQMGVSLLQSMLAQLVNGDPRWQIWTDECPNLLAALQGEYRYATTDAGDQGNKIIEVHPYEDVADNCRYAALQFVNYNRDDVRTDRPSISPVLFAI